jgi:hypothetical protein
MARGIDGSAIFRADVDRQKFVEGIGDVVTTGGAAVYLLIRTGPTPLSLLMRRLLTGHAVRFNRHYQRRGYLFQNRFKSVLVHDETYFLRLVRYIHLNPLRAGILSTLDDLDAYPWSGHRNLVNGIGPPWQFVADVLERYSPDVAVARIAYRRFVADGIPGEDDGSLEGGGFIRSERGWQLAEKLRRAREAWAPAERVLGSSPTCRNLEAALPPALPSMTPRWPTVDVNSLIDSIVRHLSVGQEIIAGNSRDRAITRVRTLLVHVLVQRCGLSLNETARVLGISKWRVRRAVRRAVTAVELADIDAWLEHM